MSGALGVERREGETWRQCAERCANEAGGLGAEVLEEVVWVPRRKVS